ncbi:MAG: ligand-binding sensor domain-containing protein [Chitinivibrionales bacterium]
MLKSALVFLMLTASMISAQEDSSSHGDFGMEWQTFITDAPVTAFTVSGKKLWYITSAGGGLYNTAANSKSTINSFAEIPAIEVAALATDCTGGIWAGSPSGLAYASNGSSFKMITDKAAAAAAVNTIYPTKSAVWIGTENGLLKYSNGTWESFTTEAGLAGNSVRSITASEKNVVWVATNKGVSEFDGTAWKTHDMNSGLSWNDAKVIGYDPRKSEVWVAVGEQDVNCYDGKEWKTFMSIQPEIGSLMIDTQSRVWLGSSQGLVKYNGFEWVYDQKKIGIPATMIGELYRDDNGDMWFGAETGILHLDNPYPY